MSGSSKADLAAAATSTVLTADQLMRAIEASHEGKEDHAKKHIGYAAVGAAVAVGAMELLRRDELHKLHDGSRSSSISDEETTVFETDHHGHHTHKEVVRVEPRHGRDTTPDGHKRRLAEEIVGAYALGQEIMGHRKHHVAHVVAEVLGAVAALKDTKDHVQGVE